MHRSIVKTPKPAEGKAPRELPSYVVKASNVHGTGVFARRAIPPGERIIEYQGERIKWTEALRRSERKNGPVNHTFFFSLADGRVIDGGSRGNEARFINHSCEPNCEAMEHDDGRVYIYSLGDIERGEELSYNYALIYDGRHTAAIKHAFVCSCGFPSCTGTMLAPKRRKKTT
jgi:SET domain-containing protein